MVVKLGSVGLCTAVSTGAQFSRLGFCTLKVDLSGEAISSWRTSLT